MALDPWPCDDARYFLIVFQTFAQLGPVLRIRIRIRIHMFLGLLDPDSDPSVRGMDPVLDPSITKQKKVRKTLIPTAL